MRTLFYRLSNHSVNRFIFVFSFLWIAGTFVGLIAAKLLIHSHHVIFISSSVCTTLLGQLTTFVLPLITVVILCRFRHYLLLCFLLFIKAFLLGVSVLFLVHNTFSAREFLSISIAPNCCSILMLWFSYCALFGESNYQKTLAINLVFSVVFVCFLDIALIII